MDRRVRSLLSSFSGSFLPCFVIFAMAAVFCTGAQAQTTFTVTSTADTNTTGTLRYAINQANGFPRPVTIDLSGVTGTITLASSLPAITEPVGSVAITGPGASQLTISGANA